MCIHIDMANLHPPPLQKERKWWSLEGYDEGHFTLELEDPWPNKSKTPHWRRRPRPSHFTLHSRARRAQVTTEKSKWMNNPTWKPQPSLLCCNLVDMSNSVTCLSQHTCIWVAVIWCGSKNIYSPKNRLDYTLTTWQPFETQPPT